MFYFRYIWAGLSAVVLISICTVTVELIRICYSLNQNQTMKLHFMQNVTCLLFVVHCMLWWVMNMLPCGLVDRYQFYLEICYLHLQDSTVNVMLFRQSNWLSLSWGWESEHVSSALKIEAAGLSKTSLRFQRHQTSQRTAFVSHWHENLKCVRF